MKGRPRPTSESTIDGSVSCVCGGWGVRAFTKSSHFYGAHVSRTQISELGLNDYLNVTRGEKGKRQEKKAVVLFSRILLRLHFFVAESRCLSPTIRPLPLRYSGKGSG